MIKRIIFLTLITAMMTTGVNAQIPVLMYHSTYESYSQPEADANIAPSVFEDHLKTLKKNGFNAVSLENYIKHKKGEFVLPLNPVIITFDDGYTSNYSYAYPLLEKYGFCAAIFVVTSRMGSSDTMLPHFSWQEAREMEKSGVIEIFSHTDTHCKLDDADPLDLAIELRRSRYLIETNLSKRCNVIAAPNGGFDDEVIDAATAAGYEMLLMVEDLNSDIDPKGLITLKRIVVKGDMSGDDLLEEIKNNKY